MVAQSQKHGAPHAEHTHKRGNLDAHLGLHAITRATPTQRSTTIAAHISTVCSDPLRARNDMCALTIDTGSTHPSPSRMRHSQTNPQASHAASSDTQHHTPTPHDAQRQPVRQNHDRNKRNPPVRARSHTTETAAATTSTSAACVVMAATSSGAAPASTTLTRTSSAVHHGGSAAVRAATRSKQTHAHIYAI